MHHASGSPPIKGRKASIALAQRLLSDENARRARKDAVQKALDRIATGRQSQKRAVRDLKLVRRHLQNVLLMQDMLPTLDTKSARQEEEEIRVVRNLAFQVYAKIPAIENTANLHLAQGKVKVSFDHLTEVADTTRKDVEERQKGVSVFDHKHPVITESLKVLALVAKATERFFLAPKEGEEASDWASRMRGV